MGTKNAEKYVKYSAWRLNNYEQPENGFAEHQSSSIRRSQLINISELELLAKKTSAWDKRQKKSPNCQNIAATFFWINRKIAREADQKRKIEKKLLLIAEVLHFYLRT